MCGHVGIAGKLALKDEATLKRLLLLDYFRGPDSTGLAGIRGPTHQNRVRIAKVASHPLDLFDTIRFKEALNGAVSQVFMGHNRAATRGAVTNMNAHPFHVGKIVGAHNGTLSPASFTELKAKLEQDYDVDSEAIIASIDRFGIKETAKMLQGAWALVWYNLEDETLNFLRNDQRPMWLAYSDDFTRIVWASQYHMIQAAAGLSEGANKFSLYTEKKTSYQCWDTNPDQWYSFKMEQFLTPGKSPPKPTSRTVKGKEPPPVAAVAAGTSDPFGRDTAGHTTRTSHSTTTSRSNDNIRLITIICDEKDPFGGEMSKEEFVELAKYGCSWCGKLVDVLDEGITIFQRDEILLCPTCSTGVPANGPGNSNKGASTRIHVRNINKHM